MNDTPTVLLVAERDEQVCEFLVGQFLADGFDAHGAHGAEDARVKLAHLHPELLVLGELDDLHGQLELLRGIRAGGMDGLAVIVVSADCSELAELRAFREGADDYVRAPASYPLLRARCLALLRRVRGACVSRIRVGALELDTVARRATVAGDLFHLSRLEFDLLAQLASEPTRAWSKWELLRDVWGYKAQGNTRTVDAHACRLRKRLAAAGAPNLVVNVRGVGYRLSGAPVVALAPGATTPVTMIAGSNGRAS